MKKIVAFLYAPDIYVKMVFKGIYDVKLPHQKILVTGSARLDYYRFSEDSLQGRYHYLRMHPLSLAQLKSKSQKDLLDLLKLGGSPEPFFSASTILIHEDLSAIRMNA